MQYISDMFVKIFDAARYAVREHVHPTPPPPSVEDIAALQYQLGAWDPQGEACLTRRFCASKEATLAPSDLPPEGQARYFNEAEKLERELREKMHEKRWGCALN